ncbi:hypothetical protein BO94DRAFT_47290, partial [Aspergillus sclerotioniger CBS 115572]
SSLLSPSPSPSVVVAPCLPSPHRPSRSPDAQPPSVVPCDPALFLAMPPPCEFKADMDLCEPWPGSRSILPAILL